MGKESLDMMITKFLLEKTVLLSTALVLTLKGFYLAINNSQESGVMF
jgi:hypothetical protein